MEAGEEIIEERKGNMIRVRDVPVEGHSRRGRPPGRWRDRVKEYICERGASRGSWY